MYSTFTSVAENQYAKSLNPQFNNLNEIKNWNPNPNKMFIVCLFRILQGLNFL